MAGKLLDYDPVTGIKEVFHKTDNGFIIQSTQDVEQVLNHNKRMLNDDNGHYRDGNLHPVAAIPLVVLEAWRKELGSDPLAKGNRKWLIGKLNDPDNKFLRLKGGTL
jgi:hypothetical protein